MLLFALSGIFIGTMLGGLTIAAIFPAVILVLVIAWTIGAVGDTVFGPQTVEIGLLIISLQIGYLAGAALRFQLGRSEENPLPRGARHLN